MTTATKNVETILREGGFTPFHRRVVLITGLAWTFVSMELLLIGFTLPIFASLWNLSPETTGAIASAALMGSFVGSLLLGRLADRIGRRTVFQATVLWYSVFTALTATAGDPTGLFILRFLSGLGLGGMLVVDPSVLSEYLPPQSRGRYMVFLDFFWPIGNLLALGLAYYFLEVQGGQWRALFLAAAFPAFLAYIIRTLIPETPYYLAKSGRLQEAAQVLSQATGASVDAGTIEEVKGAASAPIADLFRDKLLRATIVTLAAWIALNFSYYGLFLWLPTVLPRVGIELGNIYQYLFLSVLAQFPGYLSAMWLVEAWGRKRTLAAFLILGGLSGLVFATANDYNSFIAGLFFVSFFNLGAWGAVYPYTVELFPTLLRGTAFGVAAEGAGKLTAILGPTVFGFLIASTGGILVPLVVVAVVMAIGGVVVALLGRETKGAPME